MFRVLRHGREGAWIFHFCVGHKTGIQFHSFACEYRDARLSFVTNQNIKSQSNKPYDKEDTIARLLAQGTIIYDRFNMQKEQQTKFARIAEPFSNALKIGNADRIREKMAHMQK